jgi:hypothetical protein
VFTLLDDGGLLIFDDKFRLRIFLLKFKQKISKSFLGRRWKRSAVVGGVPSKKNLGLLCQQKVGTQRIAI